MKKNILLFCCLLMLTSLFAQPTQSEIDKAMKQAQEQMKKMAGDTNLTKMMKGLMDQQKQVTDAMKNNPATTNSNSGPLYDPGEYGNVDNWKFPPKNTTLLAALPKKVFTKSELVSFLTDIYSQLSKKLPANIKSSVESISQKHNGDGSKLGALAVKGWYTNYREEALLLVVKAAMQSQDDGLLLNNCAAILNMSGIEEKAIPILNYVLQYNPGSAMLLNNLGQAYAGLGATDTAMVYLGRCIKAEPENPEANNTAGQIEATKGNTEKAIKYFEQSLKGAYTKTAELKLRKIKKGSSIVPFVRPRVKIPEYFNQFKYKFPAQCTSVNNATEAEAEYIAFRKTIGRQIELYGGKLGVLGPKTLLNPPPSRIIRKDEFIAQPFHEFCGIMARDVLKGFEDDIVSFDKKYKSDIAILEKEYRRKYDSLQKYFKERDDAASKAGCCGEGNVSCCVPDEEVSRAFDGLANQYLPKFAMICEDYQEKNMVIVNKYFDEVVYWGYLTQHPISDDYFRVGTFYPIILDYLGVMAKGGWTKIIKPYRYEPSTSATYDSLAIKEMDCPLEIEIPLVVAELSLDCDKISISGGEGAVFSYEKNFKTHQSTVSVGIGLKLALEAKMGPVKAGVSAGVSETFFITFDGKNGFSDGGLKFDVSASAGATASAGKDVKVKTEIAKEKTSLGYTVGINSGFDFNEGFLKAKPETPLNKNVNIYKPHN